MTLMTRNIGFQTGFRLEPVVQITAGDSALLIAACRMGAVAARAAVKLIRASRPLGVAVHIGSQLTTLEPFIDALDRLLADEIEHLGEILVCRIELVGEVTSPRPSDRRDRRAGTPRA